MVGPVGEHPYQPFHSDKVHTKGSSSGYPAAWEEQLQDLINAILSQDPSKITALIKSLEMEFTYFTPTNPNLQKAVQLLKQIDPEDGNGLPALDKVEKIIKLLFQSP